MTNGHITKRGAGNETEITTYGSQSAPTRSSSAIAPKNRAFVPVSVDFDCGMTLPEVRALRRKNAFLENLSTLGAPEPYFIGF